MPDGESSCGRTRPTEYREGHRIIYRKYLSTLSPEGVGGVGPNNCAERNHRCRARWKESSNSPSIYSGCFPLDGRLSPWTVINSHARMNYLTRTNLTPARSHDAGYNVNKFKSFTSIGFSDEIPICRRRNMSWTTAFIATKVGVLTTNAHGSYAHHAHSPREKANNQKDCFHAGAGIVLDGKRSHSEELH